MKSLTKLFIITIFTPLSVLAADHSTLVKEYCDCTNASNTELKKAVEKIKGGDMITASQILQNMQNQMKEMESCTLELQKKYPPESFSESEKHEVENLIQKTCPPPSVEGLENNTSTTSALPKLNSKPEKPKTATETPEVSTD